jgi:hypothetical protein
MVYSPLLLHVVDLPSNARTCELALKFLLSSTWQNCPKENGRHCTPARTRQAGRYRTSGWVEVTHELRVEDSFLQARNPIGFPLFHLNPGALVHRRAMFQAYQIDECSSEEETDW